MKRWTAPARSRSCRPPEDTVWPSTAISTIDMPLDGSEPPRSKIGSPGAPQAAGISGRPPQARRPRASRAPPRWPPPGPPPRRGTQTSRACPPRRRSPRTSAAARSAPSRFRHRVERSKGRGAAPLVRFAAQARQGRAIAFGGTTARYAMRDGERCGGTSAAPVRPASGKFIAEAAETQSTQRRPLRNAPVCDVCMIPGLLLCVLCVSAASAIKLLEAGRTGVGWIYPPPSRSAAKCDRPAHRGTALGTDYCVFRSGRIGPAGPCLGNTGARWISLTGKRSGFRGEIRAARCAASWPCATPWAAGNAPGEASPAGHASAVGCTTGAYRLESGATQRRKPNEQPTHDRPLPRVRQARHPALAAVLQRPLRERRPRTLAFRPVPHPGRTGGA